MKKPISIALALLMPVVLLSNKSSAEFYVGSSVGSTDYGEIVEDVTSLELTAGYRLHENFAIEASWIELGEETIEVYDDVETEFGIDGKSVSFLTIMPLSPDIELYGKFGVFYWEQESSNLTTSALIRSNGHEDDADILLGAGIAIYLTDQMALRIQYQEFDVVGDNIENVSAGFTFSF